MTKILEYEILKNGSREEKICCIENIAESEKADIIQLIISRLDDDDIQVRGEAFSSLVSNRNKIAKILIKNLGSKRENLRGFCALVLANRKDSESIPEIIKLTKDSIFTVRSCALGALGFLKAYTARDAICRCLSDSNLEVKKSAIGAALDIGYDFSAKDIENINRGKDDEIDRLLRKQKI